MDLGDIIIIGGVLLSGIFSAIGAKKKKAASAKMRTALGDQARSLKRAAPINPAAAPQVATGLPKSVKMPAASQPRRWPKKPGRSVA
jgi:hypothetical protein